MKRCHELPYGARYLGDGRTRFRLWAPAQAAITLEIDDQGRTSRHAPDRDADGWFELVADAAPGARYCYRLADGLAVPDPASRFNPDDVHGPSMVVDPQAYDWPDDAWRGRPWHETVIAELHVGAATPEGTYRALEKRLDHYVALGVTALELMPLADFPGARNWGYDGVLPYAPDARYGTPADLKHFITTAHARGLMVFLDVVYNHFGPDGNYLALYAPAFFTEHHHTPWGAAINYDAPGAAAVRDFFIHNALYWTEEFHVDGLRFDAVHAILDDSRPHVLEALAERIRNGPGRERHVHLMLENDDNRAALLARDDHGHPRHYDAQWNDDFHHVFHVLLTGEHDGYYADYAQDTTHRLARVLAEGYAYQGEPSAHRGGTPRGEPSTGLPPTAFVAFLQNHDQIGNRALGDRLTTLAPPAALRAATCAWLLSPQIPLLFMGDEYGVTAPFLFFCDVTGDLANAVRNGRRNEFAAFAAFESEAARAAIPDPLALDTFYRSRMPWDAVSAPVHRTWLALYRHLLDVRRTQVMPLLPRLDGRCGAAEVHGAGALTVRWRTRDGTVLTLALNLSAQDCRGVTAADGEVLHIEPAHAAAAYAGGMLPAYSARITLTRHTA